MKSVYSMFRHSVFVFIFTTILASIGLWGCGKKEESPQSKTEVKETEAPPVRVVHTFPRDGGSLVDLDQPVYVSFSETVKSEGFSFSITPDPGQWKVSWKNDGREAVLNHAAPFSTGTEYELTLSPVKGGEETKIRFIVYGPSSLKLIQAGQDTGALDPDTAWTYRMQSVFEPDKLPEQYRSKTPLRSGTPLILKYIKARPKLKPETVEVLDRYIKRPDDPESFLYKEYTSTEHSSRLPQLGPREAWADDSDDPRPTLLFKINCDTAPIKVWAPKHMKAKAIDAKNKIDTQYKRGYMYAGFKQLMGREPLEDTLDRPNGGDNRLDIYMLPHSKVGAMGLTIPCMMQWFENVAAAYIFIDWSLSGKKLAATLAHELFHAFQFNFDLYEDDWWMEATAVWAEDYIEQSWDVEQGYIPEAFDYEKNALRSLTIEDEKHEYGIYLYPYFLSKEYGDEVIAEIWKACETKDSLDALDGAVPDGLDESLKRFAIPLTDYGKKKGEIRKSGEKDMYIFWEHSFKEIEIKTPDKEISETIKVPPLGVTYVRVKNQLENPESTPMVRFDLKSFSNNEDLTIEAIFDPKNEARKEDWTGREERELCLNRSEEKFKELAIVVTNKNRDKMAILLGDIDPDKHWWKSEIEIELDAEGCKEVTGTATVTATLKEETHTKWEDTSPHGDVQRTQTDLEGGGTATVRLTFEKKDSSYDDQTKTVTQYYDITNSTVQSFNIHGRSYYYTSNYYKDRECTCTKKIIKNPTLGHYDVEDSGGMSVTFDSETMKAKYVALPALVVFHDTREKSKTSYEGCCGSEGDENTIDMKHIPFVVGSVKSKDSEQLAREAKPEFDQMKKIAQDSQKLAEEIKGKMSQLQGMDDKQTEEFYKKLEERVEEFNKQHNIEQMAQNLEKKVVPEDLKVTLGDGEHSIGGGGTRTDNEQIENGTTSRIYDLKWRINLKDKPSSKN